MTHNGPSLLPLKKRLSKTQQFKRRQKIMKKGTRMEQLDSKLNAVMAATSQAFHIQALANRRRDRIQYAIHGVTLAGLGYALAKLLGYV